jgi:hypothetical protein
MRRIAVTLVLVTIACTCWRGNLLAASKSRTPVTKSIKTLKVSPEELRIRVRSLIRPTLGILEESADRILAKATDPKLRRAVLVWKIETTTTLLAAMLRPDPILALADSWGYTLQLETVLKRPSAREGPGEFLPILMGTLENLQAEFREFAGGIEGDLSCDRMEAKIRQWAAEHPIEGQLYRRPSMDPAVADLLANSGGGALAALSGLEETTADLMTRMDLYTMYLPRLARWEAELAIDDVTGGVEPKAFAAEFVRLTNAADRIAVVAENAEEIIASERSAVLETLRDERRSVTKDLQAGRQAVLDAVRQERIATLREIEAIAQRLVDRSSGPLDDAVATQLKNLTEDVESMRTRLLDDSESILTALLDRAFVRAIELLLIAAVLAAVGVVLYARFLRR